MSNLKDATRSKLKALYEEKGYQMAVAVARALLSKNINKAMSDMPEINKRAFKTSMNGELGESVLEIAVLEYCRQHPKETKDWFYTKGLILKDPEKEESDFLTELDFTLFTPECIYLFECKSYSGNKKLVERGLLVRDCGNSCDVFAQSYLHIEVLDKNVHAYASKPNYKMVMFNFSKGTLSDLRDQKAKYFMPCVDETNWESILVKNSDSVWNMQRLKKNIELIYSCSDKLRADHLKYVKSLRRDRE